MKQVIILMFGIFFLEIYKTKDTSFAEWQIFLKQNFFWGL